MFNRIVTVYPPKTVVVSSNACPTNLFSEENTKMSTMGEVETKKRHFQQLEPENNNLIIFQATDAEAALLGFDIEFYQRKWGEIHRYGADVAERKRRKSSFCRWIDSLPDQLPCTVCSNHAQEYIFEHPPKKAFNCFEWTWRFHNEVNKRKGKQEMDYETACRIHGLRL
jgi:hypothetical protein